MKHESCGAFSADLWEGIAEASLHRISRVVEMESVPLLSLAMRCARVASNVLTEAENFIRVVKEHPETLRQQTLRQESPVF